MHTNIPSKKRSLSIGGATYDLFLRMGSAAEKQEDHILLQAGGKLRVEGVTETCGGGASNTSVGLSRLGLKARFCGVVGSDQWGEALLHTLQAEGVDTTSATVVEHETSSFSIILSLATGERTILYTPGVNEHLHDVTFDVAAIEKADVVYLNHLCDTSCMIEDDIIRAIVARPEVHLTWNPGGSQIDAGMDAPDKRALLNVTNVLLLNKEEALAFTASSSIEEALSKLIACGVKCVCITDGKNGTTAAEGNKRYRCPVLKETNVVDTTGAGDAFGIGATWALTKGMALPEALVAGTLNAASVVGSIGAQAGLLTENQMQERMKQHLLSTSEFPA